MRDGLRFQTSALTIIAGGGAALATGRTWAEDKTGRRSIRPPCPSIKLNSLRTGSGFFKEAGLDCKLVQGGSGVETRDIIASSQGDIGIGYITHRMQLSNHG